MEEGKLGLLTNRVVGEMPSVQLRYSGRDACKDTAVSPGDFRFQECTHRSWEWDSIASIVTTLLSETSGVFIFSETSGPALRPT